MSVHLLVGKLTHLNKEWLIFRYNILKNGTILEGAKLVVMEPRVQQAWLLGYFR